MSQELTKSFKTKEIIVGKDSFEITEEEFQKIGKFIEGGNKGLIHLASGEYINLAFVSMIRHKKSSEPKVFGEDIPL